MKFHPIYDAHLAPLKDKHGYWFGALLILRGVLLITFTLTASSHPEVNLLLLLVSLTILLLYMLYFKLYKNKIVLLLQSLVFANLILLAGCSLYVAAVGGNNLIKSFLINLSISGTVLQFCGVVLWHSIKALKECFIMLKERQGYLKIDNIIQQKK